MRSPHPLFHHFFSALFPEHTAILASPDELIRQVTINCAERGLLLLRVRDEIRMTITSYQTLYESSIAFGMRKALVAEQRKAEMEAKVGCLRLVYYSVIVSEQSPLLRLRSITTVLL